MFFLHLLQQLRKDMASEVLGSLMTVLKSLVLKLLSSEQPTQHDPKVKPEDRDLFLDTDLIPAQNIDKEQVHINSSCSIIYVSFK